MPTDLDEDFNALSLRAEKAEAALLDLLRAPFMEWYPYAISNACALLTHPDVYPDGRKPKFKPNRCPCGIRREDTDDARTT